MTQTPASRTDPFQRPARPQDASFIPEEFAPYTGASTPRFSPVLSGITWPDPSYEIRRSRSECYVFEYVMEGKGHLRHGEESFFLEKGDAYILHEGEYHHYYSDRQQPFQKIWFNVNGSLVRHLLSDYGLDTCVKVPAFGDHQHLSAIYHAMKKEPVHCAEELALLLHQYIQTLSRFVGFQEAVPSQALAIKNYIERNLTLPLSIDSMADHVHLSRSRAIHLFKETYGVTPYHYYLNQKAELARTLLKCTTLSVQEISERLGFSDYHHFSGFFRKWCGTAPSRYR